jgi:TetR/AcrR family transcriptional regulator of autoinduction and epiphytic fitness
VSTSDLDPRVERSRARILDAALHELGEVGYGSLTIEGVAKRAGVGKATVYRHWDGKLDLVADAVVQLKQIDPPPPDADVVDQIVDTVRALAAALAGSRLAQCLPALIDAAERDAAVREFHHRTSEARRSHLVGLVERAQREGRLDPAADALLLGESLVGPLFLRRLMTDAPFPPDDVDRLVATVLGPHRR